MTDVSNGDLDPDFRLDPELTLFARVGQQLQSRLVIGDADSLSDDAKDLMAIYVRQAIVDGQVSGSLQLWVAEVFSRYLYDDLKSLDAGFNQKVRGRPLRMTPKMKRKVFEVYTAALRTAYSEGITGREAEILGERAAYRELYGRTVAEATWPDGEGAISDSLDRIRAVVKSFYNRK